MEIRKIANNSSEDDLYKEIFSIIEIYVEKTSCIISLNYLTIWEVIPGKMAIVHFDADNGFDFGFSMVAVFEKSSPKRSTYNCYDIREIDSNYGPMRSVNVEKRDEESIVITWLSGGTKKEKEVRI